MSDLRTIRTDVVGSLLRPEAVKQARVRFDEGKIDAAELRRSRTRRCRVPSSCRKASASTWSATARCAG